MGMLDLGAVMDEVRGTVAEVADLAPEDIGPDTPLIGPRAVLKSRALVELLLAMEEFAGERLGAEFDWTSDAAFSPSRSPFRTVGALAGHLHGLQSS